MMLEMEEVINSVNSTQLYEEYYTQRFKNETSNPFPDVYRTVVGTCIFFCAIPFIVLHFRCCPLRTTTVLLFGAGLMVVFDIISPANAYQSMGRQERLTVIFILIGMNILVEYVYLEEIVRLLVRLMLKPDQRFVLYVLRSSILSFFLSMFFTPDISCLFLVPVLLECFTEMEAPRNELETLLLGVATSATLGGSTLLFSGAPLAIIAASTQSFHSRLDLVACCRYLLPASIICFMLNFALLILYHYRVSVISVKCCRGVLSSACRRLRRNDSNTELSGLTRAVANLVSSAGTGGPPSSHNGYVHQGAADYQYTDTVHDDRLVQAPTLETIIEDEILELPEYPVTWTTFMSGDQSNEHAAGFTDPALGPASPSLRRTITGTDDLTSLDPECLASSPQDSPSLDRGANTALSDLQASPGLSRSMGAVSRSLGALSAVDVTAVRITQRVEVARSGRGIIKGALLVVLLSVVALLLAAHSFTSIDIGFVPFGGALVVVALDTVVNRKSPAHVIQKVDWSIIILFFSLFVWVDGFTVTRVPQFVWSRLGFESCEFVEVSSIVVFAILIVFTSNMFGQIPVTLMILSQLQTERTSASILRPVLYLAWVVSLFGNLTLISGGSAVSVVVDPKRQQNGSPRSRARTQRSAHSFRLGYFSYLKFALPSNLLSLVVGLFIISLILIAN